MSKATLLHRESSTKSLKAIVENAHRQRLLCEEYQIEVSNGQVVLSCLKSTILQKQTSTDEGFESDVDSISIISTDDSFTSTSKNQETDSANGSACSDSDDTECSTSNKPANVDQPKPTHIQPIHKESFNLVNCVCYTDIKYPDVLVFVILNEALVFKFDNLEELQSFHSNFSTIKAVSNQRAYYTSKSNKFNLLQRTDSNGVTHIEISRQNEYQPNFQDDYEPTSIISINTPDNNTPKSTNFLKKSLSSENLLDSPQDTLKKVWNSAENLLDIPKKPRRKQKGPAPQPPVNQNILKGQFVRVNVLKVDQKPKYLPPKPETTTFAFLRPKIPQTFHQFKFSDPKKIAEPMQKYSSWTNSMPRLLKKPRSEPRLFAPMAYRYTDATLNLPPPKPPSSYIPRYKSNANNNTISNRLFGMSSKLKDFGSVQSGCNLNNKYQTKDPRYSSLGNLTDGTLKSVIKKDDAKRKNDKKVTFSAYNTVQVV